jgi:hypothetical protein
MQVNMRVDISITNDHQEHSSDLLPAHLIMKNPPNAISLERFRGDFTSTHRISQKRRPKRASGKEISSYHSSNNFHVSRSRMLHKSIDAAHPPTRNWISFSSNGEQENDLPSSFFSSSCVLPRLALIAHGIESRGTFVIYYHDSLCLYIFS